MSVGVARREQLALGERIYRAGIAAKGVAACSACHSPHGAGNAPAGFPRIAGQHADYIVARLKDYRERRRVHDETGRDYGWGGGIPQRERDGGSGQLCPRIALSRSATAWRAGDWGWLPRSP